MGTKNNNALFYTCSLIEFIGRDRKNVDMRLLMNLEKKLLREFMTIQMYFIVNR